MAFSTNSKGQQRRTPVLVKSAIATAIAVAVSSAYAESTPRAKIRLALDDAISSKPDAKTDNFDGRLAVNGLIQSHPDPLFVQLEKRYQALPPFDQASEEIPEQYVVEATVPERVMAGVMSFADNAPRYVPNIASYVRHDDIEEDTGRTDDNDVPIDDDYSTVLAIVNPTFEYRQERKKWRLFARYDYEQGRYFDSRDDTIRDHTVDVKWTRRLEKGQEVEVAGLYQDTHDRNTRDPIEDFDSLLESERLKYERSLVNVTYRRGTLRDRTRYNVYAYKEVSDLNGTDLFLTGYDLDRLGVGGRYDWQLRRQMSLVGELRYNDFDYDLTYRDNKHVRALVGTDMILGRRIRANVRLGYEEKKFDRSLVNDSISEPVWEGMVEWALRRSTYVKLETARSIFELATTNSPIDTGNFNIQEWVKTSWKERWTDRLSTETSFTLRDTERVGRNSNEDAVQFMVSATYQFTDRWRFALDGAYTKEEDDLGADLSRRTFTVRTDYSL